MSAACSECHGIGRDDNALFWCSPCKGTGIEGGGGRTDDEAMADAADQLHKVGLDA